VECVREKSSLEKGELPCSVNVGLHCRKITSYRLLYSHISI
jgi:hypothetical protein